LIYDFIILADPLVLTPILYIFVGHRLDFFYRICNFLAHMPFLHTVV